MSIYSAEQLDQYFAHIKYPRSFHAQNRLEFLTELQQRQLVHVPFESLSLHYSLDRTVSLNPQDLFSKVVTNGRGGYCLENNSFFAGILRSVGFDVMSVVCRISLATRGVPGGGWRGMSHMANVVRINDRRYLVDVGYGIDGPTRPLPLGSGQVLQGLPGQQLMLEHKKLSQHSDPSQRVWVYSHSKTPGTWTEIYNFADAEMFAADFEILNHYNMSLSLFARTVVVQRFVLSESSGQQDLTGALLLVRDTVKSRVESVDETIETLETEQQRIAALEKYFNIKLTEEQLQAIQGTESELKG